MKPEELEEWIRGNLHQPWQERWRAQWADSPFWEPFVGPHIAEPVTPGPTKFVGLRATTGEGVTVQLQGWDWDAVQHLASRLEVEL